MSNPQIPVEVPADVRQVDGEVDGEVYQTHAGTKKDEGNIRRPEGLGRVAEETED